MRRPRGTRGPRRIGMGEAALKGALAGAAGGVAMIVARRAEAGAGMTDDVQGPAPRAVGRAARATGVRMSADQRALAGAGAQIAAAAAVGAVYGVISSQLRLPVAAQGSALAAIVYVANVWGLMPRAGLLEMPTDMPLREALAPAGTHAVFGLATARAFDMLMRR